MNIQILIVFYRSYELWNDIMSVLYGCLTTLLGLYGWSLLINLDEIYTYIEQYFKKLVKHTKK